MASSIIYYPGGYEPSSPVQNKAQQWSNGLQPGDPTPAGYMAWDAEGNVTSQRALTSAETAELAATDAADILTQNQTVTLEQLLADLAIIQTWLTNHPTGAVLTATQTRVLARLLFNLTLFAAQQYTTPPVTS